MGGGPAGRSEELQRGKFFQVEGTTHLEESKDEDSGHEGRNMVFLGLKRVCFVKDLVSSKEEMVFTTLFYSVDLISQFQ